MTERETAAKENWRKRKKKPPRVPGMPWVSFKVCLGIAIAWSVMGGASIGWTEGCTIDIDIAKCPRRRTITRTNTKTKVFLFYRFCFAPRNVGGTTGAGWTVHAFALSSHSLCFSLSFCSIRLLLFHLVNLEFGLQTYLLY